MVALYHRAIATAWSSARREKSEKSIGQRIRRISIIVVSPTSASSGAGASEMPRSSADHGIERSFGYNDPNSKRPHGEKIRGRVGFCPLSGTTATLHSGKQRARSLHFRAIEARW